MFSELSQVYFNTRVSERSSNDFFRISNYHRECLMKEDGEMRISPPNAQRRDRWMKGSYCMTELFRKHYSYGETIPILDTQVGMIVDIYEVSGGMNEQPHLKGVFVATAGPMKSLPSIVDPLDNESKVIHISNIPVPIPNARTVDISLIFEVSGYRWTPSPEGPNEGSLVAFDLRCRAAFSVFGKSYTLLLDQRPCSITLTKQQWFAPQMQMPFRNAGSFDQDDQRRMQQVGMQGTNDGGGSVPGYTVTNQLDVEERLRQLSTKLLARS